MIRFVLHVAFILALALAFGIAPHGAFARGVDADPAAIAPTLPLVPVAAQGTPGGDDDGQVPGGTESAGTGVSGSPTASSDAPTVSAEGSTTGEEGDAKPTEAPKWWNLSLSADISHNFAKERPSLGSSFGFDPSFMIPITNDYKLNLGVHVGFNISHDYGRTDQFGGKNPNFTTVDGDVSSIRLGIPFYRFKDAGISLGSSIAFSIPWTSRYQGQRNGWYFAYAPGLSLSWSKWGVSLSVSGTFQQNVHRTNWIYVDDEGGSGYHLAQYRAAGRFGLGYSISGFSINLSFGINRSWLYLRSLSEQERIALSYGAEIGYSFGETGIAVLEQFSMTLGVTTAGPERRYGGFGSDRVYPGHPLFTQMYFGLNWSY